MTEKNININNNDNF